LENHLIKNGLLACTAIWLSGFMVSPAIATADDLAYRTAMANALRAAANHVLPSVVTIELVGVAAGTTGEIEQDAPTSGVVVDSSGLVLASSIVVDRPSASILVVLPDETRYAAELVSRDYHRDLVLLKINAPEPLAAITFPDELDLRIGRTTVAVGRYGRQGLPMISTGILSATERLDGIALQTDARVSPAFYGGPLLDLYGNVLGILIPAVAEGGAPDATSWYDSGIAFAIPTDIIRQKLDRLRRGEDIKKGLIGIVAKAEDPYENETELAAVRNRSPAQAAGLKPGDRILAVDGTPVQRHQEIKQVLGRFDAGESLTLKFLRDGVEQQVEVTLTDSIPPLQPQRIGIAVAQRAVDQQERAEKDDSIQDKPGNDEDAKDQAEDAASMVVITAIVPGSPAEGALEPGDVLKRLGQAEIRETASLRRQLLSATPEEAVLIRVVRDDKELDIELSPQSVSGPALPEMPALWRDRERADWKISELKLPDAANVAALVAPARRAADEDDETQASLGLLVLLQGPGQPAPQETLKAWSDKAAELGVVVCVIAAADNSRWQPQEIDIVTRFAAAAMKQADIDPNAVAVAAPGAIEGGKAEASDTMALAVALSSAETFQGVAVAEATRAPAVRVRENDAAESIQLLLPIAAGDLPTWATALKSAGYPVVLGGSVDQAALLRWTRLLQTI